MENSGEKEMTEGTLSANEIAVGSLLAGGRGGIGGAWNAGAWPAVGSVGAPYANMATVQHSLDDTKDCVRSGNEALRSEFNHSSVLHQLFAQQLQAGQTHLEMTREMAAIRAEGAECCCELKGEIKDLEVSRLKDELAKSRDANNITATVQGTAAAIGPVVAQAVAQALAQIHHPS